MPASVERELLRVRRLAVSAVAIGAFGDAALIVGLALGSVALAARLAGHFVAPSAWWLLALLPPVGWAVSQALRRRPSAALCAAHLDRRYRLGGLLLAGLECQGDAWRPLLRARLQDAIAPRPRLDPWRGVGRATLGAAFLAGVALLPPPDPYGPDAPSRALESAVADLDARVERAVTAEVVPPARAEELRARVQELEARLADGESVAWSDIDSVRERLAHEQGVQAGGLAAARASARALAQGVAEAGELTKLDPKTFGDLAKLAEHAKALGLDQDLPDDLRQALEALAKAAADGGETGSLDPKALGLDAEQLRRLAEALQGAAGQRLAHAASRLPADQLGDLRALLEGEGAAALGAGTGLPSAQRGDGQFDPTPGPHGEGAPGRGGVDRGRADAALDGTHTMDVDVAKLHAERLQQYGTLNQ